MVVNFPPLSDAQCPKSTALMVNIASLPSFAGTRSNAVLSVAPKQQFYVLGSVFVCCIVCGVYDFRAMRDALHV
jgi:hypothetical protein